MTAISRRGPRKRFQVPRQGMAGCLIVLTLMTVSSSLLLGQARMAFYQRKQARHEFQLEQTWWLLRAGHQRAAEQLTREGTYQGETWQPTDLGETYRSAQVEITRDGSAQDPAEADSPTDTNPQEAKFLIVASIQRSDQPDTRTRVSRIFHIGY